jgi:ABC-2 type transport system permease protein
MMDDIRTMLWKEWKEFFLQRGSSRKTMLISALLPVILLGIVIPWRAGPAYADNMVALIVPALMPLLFVLVLVADSFAGERERHTLETLLATRLSDQVILLGKMTAAVLYAWSVFVITLAVGLLGINIMYGHGHLIMFPMGRLVPTLVYDFLLAVLLSCIGVFVSLRATTVRQAMQILNLGFMLTVWGSFFGFEALPRQWRLVLLRVLAGDNLFQTEIIAGVSLIAADVALLVATRARFRRARLILD